MADQVDLHASAVYLLRFAEKSRAEQEWAELEGERRKAEKLCSALEQEMRKAFSKVLEELQLNPETDRTQADALFLQWEDARQAVDEKTQAAFRAYSKMKCAQAKCVE